MKTAKVITVDGLNARFLGAYGNTWVQTPFLDQFAARSLVADNFIAEAFDKSVLMQRLANASRSQLEPDLPSAHQLFGYQKTTLITDDETFATTFGNLFQTVEWVQIESVPADTNQTETQSETHFDRLFSVAALHDSPSDSSDTSASELVWIHSSGMSIRWDAPLEMQEHFKDESDPEPRSFFSAPFLTLDDDFDPDQRTEILHAYAAEVRSLDESMERYFEAIENHISSVTPRLTLFGGLRGCPLGEHLHVGIPPENKRQNDDQAAFDGNCPTDELYSENLHVPFFVTTNVITSESDKSNLQFDDARVDQFIQTSGVGSILREWLDSPEYEDLEIPTQSIAISICKDQSRIQTGDWSLILTSDQDPNLLETTGNENEYRQELFAKPDDRLEINEVSGICKEIADELEARLQKELIERGFAS